ncbi:hypothetical protein [Acidithiobacillus ferrooxidans]|uniref:hypothetical protein n=1 Tax=Acidithiobacillus ferrooxidans TaxID=920 RepID=UPI0013D65E26|nr:hypothetical protein [Acidithiobacillus ferrooxidans]
MSQSLAATGTVNIAHLEVNQRECFVNDLYSILDVEGVAVNTQNHVVHFHAFGEVCAGDDVLNDLHELAKKYSVNFMANIDQNDEGDAVYFFGVDAEAIRALKIEYAVNTAADAFRFIGVEPKWLRPALQRLAEQKPIRAVLCEDAGTRLWLDADVPVDLLLLDLDIEGAPTGNIITGLDEETSLYATSMGTDAEKGPDLDNVEKFFERFSACIDG